MRLPGGRRWHWAQVVAALICAAALLLLAKSCIAAPGNAPIAHAQADAVTPPAASSGLTETTNTFDLTLSTVGYSPSADTGDYWPRRGLGGPQVITITAAAALNLSGAGDPRVRRGGGRNILPNICRLEARYQYRDGSGAWGNTGAWQTAAWRLWDNYNPGDNYPNPKWYGASYFNITPVDGQQYSGRGIQARLPIAADGSFAGVTRQYRVQARLVYGDGSVFSDFIDADRSTSLFPNIGDLLNPTSPPDNQRLAYRPSCDKVSVDSAARAGNWTTGPSIAPESITPQLSARHTQPGANSPLRWFGLPNAARIVAKPGITLNAPPGTDTAGIGIEYAVTAGCNSIRIASCRSEEETIWLSAQETGGFDGVIVIPLGQSIYRQMRLRFGNAYGWGAPTGISLPFYAPSRVPGTAEGNRLLNAVERGLTTWYPKSAGTAETAVWQYGEGVFLDGLVDYPPSYDDVTLRTTFAGFHNGIYVHRQGFGGAPVAAPGTIVFHWQPTESLTDLVAATAVRTNNQGYVAQISAGLAGAWALSSVDNEAANRLLVYRPCQYTPGASWDRYVVQTNTVTDWRLRGWYRCGPGANQPNIIATPRVARQVGQRAGVTSYAGNGIRITAGKTYTLTARQGSASIYATDGKAIIHSSGTAATPLFFLNPGIYEILTDRENGASFDTELKAVDSETGGILPERLTVNSLAIQNAPSPGQAQIWIAGWNEVDRATTYEYQYRTEAPSGTRFGGGMSGTNGANIEADYRTRRLGVRVRALRLDANTGGYDYSSWSSWRYQNAAPPAPAGGAVPPAGSAAPVERGVNPSAVAAAISGVLAELNITGADNAAAAPVLAVVICGMIAGVLFIMSFLATGGGTTSAFLGGMLALLWWMGAGPIFFGMSLFVAVIPGIFLVIGAGMVMLKRFGV